MAFSFTLTNVSNTSIVEEERRKGSDGRGRGSERKQKCSSPEFLEESKIGYR